MDELTTTAAAMIAAIKTISTRASVFGEDKNSFELL